jgi:hypothetical protein
LPFVGRARHRLGCLDALGQAPQPDRQLGAILATPSRCDLTRALQAEISRARDQLLIVLAYPDWSSPLTTDSSVSSRPADVQRKVTGGHRAMWAAESEAAIRTVVDTAHLSGANPFGLILRTVVVSNPPLQAWVIAIAAAVVPVRDRARRSAPANREG